MTALPVALWEAWLRDVSSHELTKKQWAKAVNRLDGSEKNTYPDMRELIRHSFADNELLMLWYTTRDDDDPDLQDMHKFCENEMKRRCADATAIAT